jgi:hypothetical protein
VTASATIDRHDVEAYLAAVRDELADLSPDERDDLLADVEVSILESAEESDAPIAARLGPPADFVAELRAAAGLGGAPPRARTWRRPSLGELWSDPRTAAAVRVLRELAPIWWVARAYVVVAILAWLSGQGRDVYPQEVYGLGPPHFGVVLLALAVMASIGLGLWQRHRHSGRLGRPIVVANVVLALLAVPLYENAHDWLTNRPVAFYPEEAVVMAGLANDGVPVANVYPYSRDGRLLLDVLLFDQNGAPLYIRPDTGATDAERRVLRTRDDAELFNSYPIRYYEPGTTRVARPYAGPAIAWASIATPPLPVSEKPATK